jgi:hypothetical protein
MARIYSYVVRYDSGFAPNPFYGHCTLATCKPDIRRAAKIGDWVIGSASNARGIRRGGNMVYAMRVTEAMTFDTYSRDTRFEAKKPFRRGSRKQSCGDNIYYRDTPESDWHQRDSFHSTEEGRLHALHVARDTGVNRVLISEDFIYFGGTGPAFPEDLQDENGKRLCKHGIGRSCFYDPQLSIDLERWIRSLDMRGYQGPPQEWISLRG